MKRAWPLLLAALAACGDGGPRPPVEAREFEDPGFVTDGDFEMRYGTVLASDLPAEVAARHGIERRDDAVVLSVSVLRRRASGVPLPVEAEVTGSWRGLVTERQPLAFRQVTAAEAVSWLAVAPVRDDEAITLEFAATPAGATRPLTARITRSFDTG